LTTINERQITYNDYRSARYLGDAGMAKDYEQPVNRERIVVLVAIALPVFGGLYYALLDFLLFGGKHELPWLT
jgi:hypothetical protein